MEPETLRLWMDEIKKRVLGVDLEGGGEEGFIK